MKVRVLCTGQITANQLPYVKEQLARQIIQPELAVFYIDQNPAKGIDNRRKRIANNHKELEQLVKATNCDYVWQIEGDSELPPKTLQRLLSWASFLNDNFAFISGAQVGRHGVYAIGAWYVKPDYFISVNPKEKGLVRIDATGWYCLLAPKDKWLEGQASWQGERYGPDVVWGLSIKGNKYVDMGLEIGHNTGRGVIRPSDPSTCIAEFTYKKAENKWVFKQK